jgi:hypothetical protein
MASLVVGASALVMVVVTGAATMLRVQVTFVMVAAAEAWTMIGISVLRGLLTFHSLNDHLQVRLNLSILLYLRAKSISWSAHTLYNRWSRDAKKQTEQEGKG